MPEQNASTPVDSKLSAKPSGWVEAVKSHDLFEGDFGDDNEHIITNEIRVVQRSSACFECGQKTVKGQLCWDLRMADNEGMYGGRVCEACCDAIADLTLRADDEDYDPFDALEARICMNPRLR